MFRYNDSIYRPNYYLKSYFDSNGGIVVNLFNGYICYLDQTDCEKFKKLISTSETKIIHSDKMIDELIGNEIFVRRNYDEIGKVISKLAGPVNTNYHSYTVYVTQRCNMTCDYCYVKKDNYEDKSDYKKSLSRCIDKLLVQNKELNFNINWFGGEPLLKIDEILSMMDKLSKKISNKNGKLTSGIVTNGLLLTRENFIKLINKGINLVQVTFDGYRDNHNIYRKTHDHKNTFDTILDNLKSIRTLDLKFTLIVRVNYNLDNILDNGEDINKFINLFKSSFFSDDRYHLIVKPIIDYSSWGNKGEIKTYLGRVNYMIELDKKHRIFQDVLLDFISPKTSWCPFEKENSKVIRWDGKLAFCEECVSEKDYVKDFRDNDSYDNFENLPRYEDKLSSKCYKCKKLPICTGTCLIIKHKYNHNACVMSDNELNNLIKYIYEGNVMTNV